MVYVALNEDSGSNSEVYLRRSTDNGKTWQAIQRISNAPLCSEDPCIAASGSNVHIVWNDFRHGGNGHSEVYYRRSSDWGGTWGPETRLTWDTAMSYSPTVCSRDSNVEVAWGDNRNGDFDIYRKHSGDFGLTWGADERLTSDTANSGYPSVVVSGANIHEVWFDFGHGVSYLHSGDGGATWDSITPLVSGVGSPSHPFVDVAGPMLHVIWTDQRDGHPAIYYKRNPTGNTGVAQRQPLAGHRSSPAASIVHAALMLPGPRTLLDISGRKVLDLHAGPNDVSRLAPGVYFIRKAVGGQPSAVSKVVLTR